MISRVLSAVAITAALAWGTSGGSADAGHPYQFNRGFYRGPVATYGHSSFYRGYYRPAPSFYGGSYYRGYGGFNRGFHPGFNRGFYRGGGYGGCNRGGVGVFVGF